jgi:hypothetical protein
MDWVISAFCKRATPDYPGEDFIYRFVRGQRLQRFACILAARWIKPACSAWHDHERFSQSYNEASQQQRYFFSKSINHDKNSLFACSACGKQLRSGCMRKSKYGGQLRLCVLNNSLKILFMLFLSTAFPLRFDTITANRSCLKTFP